MRPLFALLKGMKISKVSRSFILGLIGSMLLSGFTGKEKYVELDGTVNGRATQSFTANDQNIRSVLPKGTRGEILETKLLPSGNYGLRIRVLNGEAKNESLWVYHKLNDSSLVLYENLPSQWNTTTPRVTASIEEAKSVKTLREVIADTQLRNQGLSTAPKMKAQNALNLIVASNSKLQSSTSSTYCATCTSASTGLDLPPLRPGKKKMARACSDMMNAQGELGPDGQSILAVMSEPQYAKHFTADNALGNLCPNFNNLDDSEKLKAWTWFWTTLAMEEASCNPKQEHATTFIDKEGNTRILNPREGYGLWALERDRNIRSWRGEACDNIGTTEKQARCAIDIMTTTQLARNKTAVDTKNSYWGPVRRGHSQMLPHMRRLRLCF